MTNRENVKNIIQEWFAEQYEPKEICKLYRDISMEIEIQLEYMLDVIIQEKLNEAKVVLN